jgi:hypothetical protein
MAVDKAGNACACEVGIAKRIQKFRLTNPDALK